MPVSRKARATILLCFTVIGFQLLNGTARAEDSDARQKRFSRSQQRVDEAKATHTLRVGCVNYTYGCGYGTYPGYGYAPSYDEGTNRAK